LPDFASSRKRPSASNEVKKKGLNRFKMAGHPPTAVAVNHLGFGGVIGINNNE
jgi:hypothetical protein